MLAEPENEELLKLKTDLEEVIQITKELAGDVDNDGLNDGGGAAGTSAKGASDAPGSSKEASKKLLWKVAKIFQFFCQTIVIWIECKIPI